MQRDPCQGRLVFPGEGSELATLDQSSSGSGDGFQVRTMGRGRLGDLEPSARLPLPFLPQHIVRCFQSMRSPKNSAVSAETRSIRSPPGLAPAPPRFRPSLGRPPTRRRTAPRPPKPAPASCWICSRKTGPRIEGSKPCMRKVPRRTRDQELHTLSRVDRGRVVLIPTLRFLGGLVTAVSTSGSA